MPTTTIVLRRQIASAGDLKAVVRTMKASAAAAIGQYEKSVAALADYAHTVELGLSVCLRSVDATDGTGPDAQAVARRVNDTALRAIVFGSDQGLVGRFNETVVEHAMTHLGALPAQAQIWAVGERVQARLLDADMPLAGTFPVPGSVELITRLVGQILLKVQAVDGETLGHARGGTLMLFHNRPTASGYEPVSLRLLPLDERWRRTSPHPLAHRGICPRCWAGPAARRGDPAGPGSRVPVRIAVPRLRRVPGQRKRQPPGGDAARGPEYRRAAGGSERQVPPAAPARHRRGVV
jgi:F-type H+-transporting ATPase subunit gamma